MRHKIILFAVILAGCVAHVVQCAANPKPFRVSLNKKVAPQSGELGQTTISYFVDLEIGTPMLPFKMLLDIQASEIWLPHKELAIYTRLNYNRGYSKKTSSTSIKFYDVYAISYDDIELSGKAYADVVKFRGMLTGLLMVKVKQQFLAISSASSDQFSRRLDIDGVLGMSPRLTYESGSDSIIHNLARNKITNNMVFGMAICDECDSSESDELTIGGVNTNKFVAPLIYHLLLDEDSWTIGLQEVAVGNRVISVRSLDTKNSTKATLITRRNEIYGPMHDVLKIYRALDLEGAAEALSDGKLYEIDCYKTLSMPSITFYIDRVPYEISATSYIKTKVDGVMFKTNSCFVAILPNGLNNHWQLGTNFLSNFYTVFDAGMQQVALGTLK